MVLQVEEQALDDEDKAFVTKRKSSEQHARNIYTCGSERGHQTGGPNEYSICNVSACVRSIFSWFSNALRASACACNVVIRAL